eukprot:Tbor_TRINITY_DN6230_c2_g2::TRINITY_DN6230_c2_g2_i6::g.1717::m.1717
MVIKCTPMSMLLKLRPPHVSIEVRKGRVLVRQNIPGDIPYNEPSKISVKRSKSQKVWEKLPCKLEEEELSLEEIIGYEDRKKFITDLKFVYGSNYNRNTIEKKIKQEDKPVEMKEGDMPAVLMKQINDAEETKNFPYLATTKPIR